MLTPMDSNKAGGPVAPQRRDNMGAAGQETRRAKWCYCTGPCRYADLLRRIAAARPPRARSASVAGSGTAPTGPPPRGAPMPRP